MQCQVATLTRKHLVRFAKRPTTASLHSNVLPRSPIVQEHFMDSRLTTQLRTSNSNEGSRVSCLIILVKGRDGFN
jgi:hypothetical protein